MVVSKGATYPKSENKEGSTETLVLNVKGGIRH